MKPFAARTDALRQSDIRAVTFEVNRVGGINLGQGICDLATPAPIVEATVEALQHGSQIYTAYNGTSDLREAVAEKARSFNGIPVEGPESVVVSTGSTGAFLATVLTLFEPGDEVVLFEPFYGYHAGILRLQGVEPVAVPLAKTGGRWRFEADRLAAAITGRTKAVLVCTPANPSGKVWDEGELRALYAEAERHDLWVLTDEIYEHMVYDGRRHLSPASLDGAYERTVTLSGFSKTFNMTGWRLGYAVAPVAVAEKIGLVNDLTTICAPAPLQHGLAAALPLPDDYYEQMLADYTVKRTLMVDALRACGFEADPPEGAYYVLAGLGERLGQPGFEDARAATTTLIETAGVACVPGPSFFADPADGDGHLRFCYAKERPVLEEACERLVDAFG
ncbi:pyridoxal phosphate-dependent aminotransferase [Rubrivirga marina]|uniref:Aminotransferase n=1 Tax=Rubrivirga marina TaxID=1196024 RepID=A0A271J3G2_9BACT|nr:pyridoxal phosphate-dependent aminotransferase [Rubrivirga marina]PAP77584.1 aspartate aminotransferase [Rubrivirga marina]